MTLRSVEMVSLLRILSILHISLCLPLRWLAGNCGDLGEYGFGVADMPKVLDLMDQAFAEIIEDGDMMLDDDFMMEIFKPLARSIEPFQDYLTFIFEGKRSNRVGSRAEEDKVLPWHLVREELFFPTRKDIIQSTEFSAVLAVEAAAVFRIEFRDARKATAKYLSDINGAKSMKNVTAAERLAGRGIDASNSISESLHASSTYNLQLGSTIRLDHCAAEGQTRSNNDLGRDHLSLVTGRKPKLDRNSKGIGTFHKLPQELQRTAILSAQENAGDNKRRFDIALEKQFEKRRMKEEIALQEKYKGASNDYIVAIYFFEQFHSPRCWNTVEEAEEFYSELKSESKRLEAVKEQILIRYLGLGWEDAHHPWSEGGPAGRNSFTSKRLFEHLVEVVIPMADVLEVPTEPPVTIPTLPNMQTLGTMSELAEDLEKLSEEKLIDFKKKAHDEIDQREERGDGDRWYERQRITAPKLDKNLKGFHIEMLFSYSSDDGTQCFGWYHGIIQQVVNEKTNRVRIKWDEECLGEDDVRVSDHKLVLGNWNPKTVKKGGWREYLTKE